MSSILEATKDILATELFPSPAITTYTWHFKISESSPPHKISIRHCQVTGTWILLIDGLHKCSGCEPLINRRFFVKFVLEENLEGVINFDGSGSIGYIVNMKVGDNEYPENRCLTDISLGESIPVMVTVPGHKLLKQSEEDGGSSTVWYQIFVKTSTGEEHMIEKRYSELNMLDSIIRSQTASHLSGSLPTLPGKVWNPFTDQTSETFIYQRRTAIELYLSMLVGNSKVVHYQELLYFFGLDPMTGLPKST